MISFPSPQVQAVYDQAPITHRPHLLKLRSLILAVGEQELPCALQETLKWGEASFLPTKPRIGTTVRVGVFDDEHVGLYVSCQTQLVERYRAIWGDELTYSKNRAVVLPVSEPLPERCLQQCVSEALNYHRNKVR